MSLITYNEVHTVLAAAQAQVGRMKSDLRPIAALDTPATRAMEEEVDELDGAIDALRDMMTPIPGVETEIVIHRWSRKHGDCYDCGNPAAFMLTGYEDKGQIAPEEDPTLRRCAVCAANAAADGETIARIDPEEGL